MRVHLMWLLAQVRFAGLTLSRNGEFLHVTPKTAVTNELKAQLVTHRGELLGLIDEGASDEPFDIFDPNFVEIVLLWRERVLNHSRDSVAEGPIAPELDLTPGYTPVKGDCSALAEGRS